ncbi:unnamed protein product, partial [Urochloa humidicola]
HLLSPALTCTAAGVAGPALAPAPRGHDQGRRIRRRGDRDLEPVARALSAAPGWSLVATVARTQATLDGGESLLFGTPLSLSFSSNS